mgnify:CR=1 FL=1
MSTTNVQLYEALIKAGVDYPTARLAAEEILYADARDGLATKSELAELRLELLRAGRSDMRWIIGAIIAMTAVFAAIVKLL